MAGVIGTFIAGCIFIGAPLIGIKPTLVSVDTEFLCGVILWAAAAISYSISDVHRSEEGSRTR